MARILNEINFQSSIEDIHDEIIFDSGAAEATFDTVWLTSDVNPITVSVLNFNSNIIGDNTTTTDGVWFTSDIGESIDVNILNFDSIRTLWNYHNEQSTRELFCACIIEFASELLLDNTDIEYFSLLEELVAEGSTPIGNISSNELMLSLKNTNRRFSPLNQESPYYNQIVPNKKINIFIGLNINDHVEYVYLGKFFSTDWEAPTESLMALVTCNDKLYTVGNSPIPQLPVMEKINYSTLLRIIFKAIGLNDNEFSIDYIPFSLDVAILPEGQNVYIKDILQKITESGLCNIFIDREDKIKVLRSNNVEEYSHLWTDNNMIISLDYPTKYSDLFSEVNVNYYTPIVGDSQVILNLPSAVINSGTNILNNLIFNTSVGAVENIRLIGSINSYIEYMTIGGSSITLIIENTGGDEIVDIEIIGRPVNFVQSSVSIIDSDTRNKIGDVRLEINNDFIQTKDRAQNYANSIMKLVTDLAGYILIESRGNPHLKLSNTLRINSIIDNVLNLDIIPLRNYIIFDSGLSCSTYGIKKSIREQL
jgi:hypothetical protein